MAQHNDTIYSEVDYTIQHKGWTLDVGEMTATCPHGYVTEIDNDAEDGCKSILNELGL